MPPFHGKNRPRSSLIPSLRPKSQWVGVLPRVTMILGRTRPICAASHSQQAAISSFVGTRFPGGRHFTTLVMYTSSRLIPALSKILVRSWPAGPTKGPPVWSSTSPGASPISIRTVGARPSPNTTWVRLSLNGQRRQERTLRRKSSRDGEKPGKGRHLRAGAGNGNRTRDLRLGTPTLYQLSYARAGIIIPVSPRGGAPGRAWAPPGGSSGWPRRPWKRTRIFR